MFYLEEKYLELVKEILAKNLNKKPKVYVYGSRAKGNCWQYSDLDLAISEKIDDNIYTKLKNDFSESLLPIFVDILIIPATKETFLNCIKNDFIELKY